MKTLDAIKQEYARENNFCEWSDILYSTDDPAEIDEHFDKVARLFAVEVAKETLKNASDNATTKHGYFSDGSTGAFRVVDKQSILSEDNIPKEVKS